MKAFIVYLSMFVVALASLEPAGYRPPNLLYQQEQRHHYHHHQSQKSNPSLLSSSEYLPPNLDHSTVLHSLSSQYFPQGNHHCNNQQQHQLNQEMSLPSINYLSVTDKQRNVLPTQSSNAYAPVISSSRQDPQNESTILLRKYLAPSVPTVSTSLNEYLPALSSRQLPSTTNSLKTNYLPQLSSSELMHNGNYLPPSRSNMIPTTSVPRISVLSSSPYKFDGLVYYMAEHHSKFSSSRLDTSSLLSSREYPTSTPSFELINNRQISFDRPTDNYLPPIQSAGNHHQASQIGYRYSEKTSSGTGAEQVSVSYVYYK